MIQLPWKSDLMRLPPLWKMSREIKRLVRQVFGLPSLLLAYLFSTPYYDLYLSRKKQVTVGLQPLKDRVAIYLIYPSNGVLGSHLIALRWIVESGYEPLVVSNLKLSESDRSKLLKLCSHLIERPNFGYDFGGYRDGVLLLGNRLSQLKRLAIFNDSVWFPIPENGNWLEQAEALGVDFAGAASNYGAKRIDASDFESIEWQYSFLHKNFHHCSYALLCGARVVSDRRFFKYWKSFRLSGNKKRTVRRGEIGLSQWILKHGYSHADTLDISKLDKELSALANDRLGRVFDRMIVPDDTQLQAIKSSFENQKHPDWPTERKKMEKLILATVARQGVSYVLPEYTTKERGFQFVKKSPVWLSTEGSDITLALLAEFPDEFGKILQNEAKVLRLKLNS